MNKKITIVSVILALFVAAGAAAALNATRVSNFVKEKTQSPVEYYRMVEKNNRDAAVKNLDQQLSEALSKFSGEAQSGTVDVNLQAGDAMKPVFNHVGLDEFSIHTKYDTKDGATNSTSIVKANKKEAFTLNQYSDMKTGEMYLQIPEASEDYVGLKEGTLETQGGEILKSYEITKSICKELSQGGVIKKLLTKYSDILIDRVETVKKTQGKLEANKVSQSCTKLTVTLESKEAQEIAKAIVKELKEDKDIKKIIQGVDKNSYDEYSLLIDYMEEEMQRAKDSKAKEKLMMDVYVNDSGVIVGRELTLSSMEKKYSIRQFNVLDGNKVGSLMEVENPEGVIVSVKGKGTLKENKLSANITVSVDESLNDNPDVITDTKDMITLSIKDVDIEKAKKGESSGTYKLSTDKIKPLALYSVGFKLSGNAKKSKTVIDLYSGKTSMFTMTIAYKEADKVGTITNPAKGKQVYEITEEEQLAEYVSKIDLSKFANDLKEKTGVDITEYVPSFDPTLVGGI